MKIIQLLTPMTRVHCLVVTDTVRDAFDHMETYGVSATPIVDWAGRYTGTVTEADLRRTPDRTTALADVRKGSHVSPVTVDADAAILAGIAAPFVPVVDDAGRLIGIVERRHLPDSRLPQAA